MSWTRLSIFTKNYLSRKSKIKVVSSNFAGAVCGDKCGSTCHCGNDGVLGDEHYCCIPANASCTTSDLFYGDVWCEDGKKLRFNEFCREQDKCPKEICGAGVTTAISTDCGNEDNILCPESENVIKVCSTDKDVEDTCSSVSPLLCPKPLEGLAYSQCYNEE